jgi:hypothetical protein
VLPLRAVARLQQRTRFSTLSGLFASGLFACGGGAPSKVQQASSQPEPIKAPALALDAGNPVLSEVVPTPENERRILEYLPSAYGIVIHLSLNKLESSEFFNRYESTLLGSLGSQRQAVVSKCHFDPLLDIESVTLAVDFRNGNSPEVIIALTTSLGATRIEECVVATGGTVGPGHYDSGNEKMGFYWPTEEVLLLSDKKTSEEMAKELQAGSSLDNPTLMEFLSRTDRNATLWGAGTIPSAVAASMGSFGGIPKGFVVRGSVWAGIDLSMELSFATTKEADSLMSLLKMGLASAGQSSPARELIAATDIEQLGTVIRLDAQLSPSLSGELLKELQ